MRKLLTTLCLFIFILVSEYLINTDQISRIHIYKDFYRICFSSGSYNPDCIDIFKGNAPDFLTHFKSL